MKRFDPAIRKAVDLYSYPIWFILRDQDILCTCVDHTTKQASPTCLKCFGTGRKIKLRRVNAAHQNTDGSIRGEAISPGEKNVFSVYYTKYEIPANEEDLILDGEVLDVVHHVYHMRSNHTEPVYYKYECTPKKSNAKITKKNLKDFIRKAGYEI